MLYTWLFQNIHPCCKWEKRHWEKGHCNQAIIQVLLSQQGRNSPSENEAMGLSYSVLVLFLSFCCLENMSEEMQTLSSVSGSWDLEHIPARTDEAQELGQSQSNTTGRNVTLPQISMAVSPHRKLHLGLGVWLNEDLSAEVIINSFHWSGDVFRGNKTEATKWFLEELRAANR